MKRLKVAGTLVAVAALLLAAAPTQAVQPDGSNSTTLRFSPADVRAIQSYFSNPDNIAALSPAMKRYLESHRTLPARLSRDNTLERRLTGLIRQAPRDLEAQLSASGPSLRVVMIGRNVVMLHGANIVRDYVSIDRAPRRRPRR